MTGVQTCALPICFPVTIEVVETKPEPAVEVVVKKKARVVSGGISVEVDKEPRTVAEAMEVITKSKKVEVKVKKKEVKKMAKKSRSKITRGLKDDYGFRLGSMKHYVTTLFIGNKKRVLTRDQVTSVVRRKYDLKKTGDATVSAALSKMLKGNVLKKNDRGQYRLA